MNMTIEIYFDGLCEPKNPGGTATYGFVLYRNGERIHSDCGVVGEGNGMTNNVAEYSALFEALNWIDEQNLNDEIIIKGDSKLVIQQLNGNWKSKSRTSKEFIPKIKSLLNGRNATFLWIPREKNKEADMLTKIAYRKHLKLKNNWLVLKKCS